MTLNFDFKNFGDLFQQRPMLYILTLFTAVLILGIRVCPTSPKTDTTVSSRERANHDSIYKTWYKEALNEPDDFKSIELWGQIIAFAPDSARPYQARGFMYHKIGNYDAAISDCDKATTLDKNYALAYMLRGRANMGRKKWQEAIADFNTTLRLDSKTVKAYMYRAQACANVHKKIECCRDFSKALELASAVKDGSQDSLIRELEAMINKYCVK
jgi:tetratricopeptide (TPR) repeat protein